MTIYTCSELTLDHLESYILISSRDRGRVKDRVVPVYRDLAKPYNGTE